MRAERLRNVFASAADQIHLIGLRHRENTPTPEQRTARHSWPAMQRLLDWVKTHSNAGDVIAPMVNLFLSLTMFLLALDGRRSYKSIKAKRSDSESAESRPIG